MVLCIKVFLVSGAGFTHPRYNNNNNSRGQHTGSQIRRGSHLSATPVRLLAKDFDLRSCYL